MDIRTRLADRSPLDAPIEQRIHELAIESDSGVDTAKAFLLKVSAELALSLPVGAAIAVGLYLVVGVLLGAPGPLPDIVAAAGLGFVVRAFCMFGPLTEN